jgi:hypothetical protein
MRVCPHCHLLLGDPETACPHDATKTESTSAASPVPSALNTRLGSFEPFARGQTGTCYLATQIQTGYRGLLKVIPLGDMDASERVRLKRELRKQTQLTHEGLPRIIDGGELGDDLWMFREQVPGESLAQRIRRLGKLGVSEALIITAQVASALDELQRNGLLHRDVKAGHVIVQEGASSLPVSKLIDAGLPGRMPTGSVFDLLGTPAYISPEQVAGKLVSFRSDLYGLGCLLFEMLTGAPPFVGPDVRSVLEAHKSAPAPTPDIELPAPVQSLLRGLLSKEPRQRPFSAQQVRRTLEPFLPAGALLPALGARPMAAARAAAEAQAAAAANPITEEIELEQVDAISIQPSPKTLSLSAAEIEALEVREQSAPPAPRTLHLSTAEMNALEVGDRRSPVEVDSEGAEELPAADLEADSAAEHAPEPERRPKKIAAAPAAAEQPAQPAAPARRAVDFDVESLFDDEVPVAPAGEPRPSLLDAAPTQIYRRSDAPGDEERAIPTVAGAEAPVVPSSADAAEAGATRESPDTLPPAPPKALSVVWIGAAVAAAVVLIAVVVRSGNKTSSAPDAHVVTAGAEPRHEAAPSAAAADPSGQAEVAANNAAPAAEPQAADPAGGTQQAQAADPTAQAAQAADQQPPAAAAADQPAAAEGAVLPASVAAGAARPNDATRSAELTAANEAARSQSGSARLAQPRGSRADRLAKAEEYKAQGRSAYQAGHYREAVSAYSKATEQNPSDAAAFAGLAASHLADGDTSGAIQSYSRAVRLQPSSSGFHAALGRAYLQRGDRARARAAYEHALALDPQNGAAKTALAQLK